MFGIPQSTPAYLGARSSSKHVLHMQLRSGIRIHTFVANCYMAIALFYSCQWHNQSSSRLLILPFRSRNCVASAV